MPTIDLNPDPTETEYEEIGHYAKAFEEDGETYLEVYGVCYPRSETPDWIYEIFPHIDYISHAEITLSENSEQLWIHDWDEEGYLHVSMYIPESLKESDERYSSESLEKDGLDALAEVLAPLVEEKADRPPVGNEKIPHRNLNYLINKTGM